MADTLTGWLALREPADAAARSSSLSDAVTDRLADRQPLGVLELGTGTGSNIRYLAPRLGGRQQWLAVDRSADLLGRLPGRLVEWAAAHGHEATRDARGVLVRGPRFECRVETRQWDLDDLAPELFAERDLVTASALLDLVSEAWLRTLAGRCAARGAVGLFALTYDGRSACVPVEPEDDWIRDLLNRHQHHDKGLGGPAAGPAAPEAALRAFAAVGYETMTASSPWVLGPEASELQRQLVDGWAHAALEMMPNDAAAIDAWRARRMAHLHARRSRITVEHTDVAAWPRQRATAAGLER